MTRVEIIIIECICVRACTSVRINPLYFCFFFRFNTIKTLLWGGGGVIGYNFPWQNIAFISLKISQCRH